MEMEPEQESNESSTSTSENMYKWTLPITVLQTINGEEYTFSKSGGSYDLTEFLDDSWVESCISKGYFKHVKSSK